MKPSFALLITLAATPAIAQQTGVSHPPDAVVQDVPAVPATKPSAAVPMDAPATDAAPAATPAAIAAPANEEFKPYQPYQGATTSPAPLTLRTHVDEVGMDDGIVTEIAHHPGELPVGTLLHVRLHDEIATLSTQPNTAFTAELAQDVISDGRVVLPAGTTVEGTVTQVRGGRRIHGTALIHLEAQAVVLPDGTRMPMRGTVIDTDQYAKTRVNAEGDILHKENVGATLAAMSLTTGGAAAAGAVFGGGVGALIGAGVGAGISTVWWLKQDRQTHLPKDSLVVVSLRAPLKYAEGPMAANPNVSAVPDAVKNTQPVAAMPAPYVAQQAFVPAN